MMQLRLDEGPLDILCLGAHPDDIEIGCGGSLLEILHRHPGSRVDWVVLAASGERAEEGRCAARRFLEEAADSESIFHDFQDGFLPDSWAQVKRRFEELKQRRRPDVVFTHWSQDAHQDHRLVSELTWNTFRDHLIVEYDGDLGRPNLFVPLSGDALRRKISILMECHGSQAGKDWFDEELFRGLARVRGMECRSPEGWAEAFHLRKLTLQA